MTWTRYTAPSDRDYDDQQRSGPDTVTVECLSCGREMDVASDDRPPYKCAWCRQAALEHATQAGKRSA